MLKQTIQIHITKEREGLYFEVPFTVPKGIERIDLEYAYERRREVCDGAWTRNEEINIIDLALTAPGNNLVGASGSNRMRVWVSPAGSAQGYADTVIVPGEWNIVVGAYKIAPEGVDVTYTVTLTQKELKLYKGDAHTHTLGSDGNLTRRQLAEYARAQGLDYLIVTDHNCFSENFKSVDVEGLTVIPGVEWTHFKGHCGMLGVRKPYKNAYCVNTKEQADAKLAEARANGAAIVINHPFGNPCNWVWGIDETEFDLLELWNGAISFAGNGECLAWWQQQLVKGKKIPVIGGSDFHSAELLRIVGSPCTCVYAQSREPEDILAAMRAGCCYITQTPTGPGVAAHAGQALLGGTAPAGTPVKAEFSGLQNGDLLRVVTDSAVEEIKCGQGVSRYTWDFAPQNARFCRFEVVRPIVPGLPPTAVMLSNPIYFEVK